MRNVLLAGVTVVLIATITVFAPGTMSGSLREVFGIGSGGSARGAAPPLPGQGSFRYLQHQRGAPEVPVTYSSCRPIPVRVNTTGIGDQGAALDVVLSAMREVSRRTGLDLRYDGGSTDRPRAPRPGWQPGRRTEPVLVSFATAREVPALEGRVAGVGGSTSVRRDGLSTYVTGQVTLDIDSFDPLLDRPAFHDSARAIVMHELGHLVGLDHVSDPGELMHAQNWDQTDFGPGDLRGLALLGKGPC